MTDKTDEQSSEPLVPQEPTLLPIGVGEDAASPQPKDEKEQDEGGKKNKAKTAKRSKEPKAPTEAQKRKMYFEQLERQIDGSAGGSLIREYARLQLDYASLKKRATNAWLAVVFLVLCLGFTVWSVLFVFPKYRYIPVSNAGAVCEVAAEDSPRVTNVMVMEWAKNTALASYTYDYVNWRETLEQVGNSWYTERGKRAFRNALASSQNLDRVLQGRYIIRASVIRNPIIVESHPNSWIVDVPIAIEFHTGAQQQAQSRQTFSARVTVVRVPATSTNLRGLATENLNLAPFSPLG